MLGVIDAFLPVLDLVCVVRLGRSGQFPRGYRGPIGPFAARSGSFFASEALRALVGGLEIVGIHGEQLFAGLDHFIRRAGFE